MTTPGEKTRWETVSSSVQITITIGDAAESDVGSVWRYKPSCPCGGELLEWLVRVIYQVNVPVYGNVRAEDTCHR